MKRIPKTQRCTHCGDKREPATLDRLECVTWGRPIWLCQSCKATEK